MRVVTNEALVDKNRSRATRLFFVSLGILIFGFFFANGQLLGIVSPDQISPTLYSIGMPLILVLGFAATLASVRMTNIWVRVPRPEKAIPEGLKGISNKAALYNYHHMPVRHILVTPQGIFPLITRFQNGRFSVKGDKWKAHKGPIGSLFTIFRLDGIGNPKSEADFARRYVRYLTEDWDNSLPITPVVVFLDPRAEVTIEEPTIPVVYADSKREPNLRDFLREQGNDPIPQFKGDAYKDFLDEWEDQTLGD
jgi:hypothetical protein